MADKRESLGNPCCQQDLMMRIAKMDGIYHEWRIFVLNLGCEMPLLLHFTENWIVVLLTWWKFSVQKLRTC